MLLSLLTTVISINHYTEILRTDTPVPATDECRRHSLPVWPLQPVENGRALREPDLVSQTILPMVIQHSPFLVGRERAGESPVAWSVFSSPAGGAAQPPALFSRTRRWHE